jgi:nucleoside-diphosphate-sugar epimerase
VRKCDVVLPLVAIATPATYVREPLKVFELDFEANLPIIRHCVKYRTRVIFPSTSEVYGMCTDAEFDPYASQLVLGPINKSRWIYSCSKQLLDRIIWSYGMSDRLDFTLVRPFNWIGSGLDSINTPKEGSSRVLTQFLGNIVRGENIQLVDGGAQTRSFTYIDDAIDCLLRIIDNPGGITTGKIYNIGNPANNYSIRELAKMMLDIACSLPEYAASARRVRIVEVSSNTYYGEGYQDIQTRVPMVDNTCNDLHWRPTTDMRTALLAIFAAYSQDQQQAHDLTANGTTGPFPAIDLRDVSKRARA